MSLARSYGQLAAAVLTGLLLFVPLVLAIFPRFTRNGFPGPFVRTDAILVFFVGVPLIFTLLVAYRVAQYHGIIGSKEDRI